MVPSGDLHGRPGRPADRVGRVRSLLGTWRRWAWWLLVACVAVVAALGVAFAHQATADGFDRVLDDPVISWLGPHRDLLYWMEYPGTQVPAIVASLAMAAACLPGRRLNGAVLALVADFIATRLDDSVLKYLFHRTYLGALSYPSGHTTSIVALTAVYVVLFILPPDGAWAIRRGQPVRHGWSARGWPRWLGLAVLLALLVITVLGVIALRWHYFTDTIGGAAVALGVVSALCLLIDALWARPRARPAPAK